MESATDSPGFVPVLERWIHTGVDLVWGWGPDWLPFSLMVFALLGTGLVLTVAMEMPQVKGFGHAIQVLLGKFDDSADPGEISHFAALCTALSATVGLGNIAGVAVAVHVGGPGATLWMILTGVVGMATKYAECTLAVMYRHIDVDGHVRGGPMVYIELGLGRAWKPLGILFAFMCVISSFGAANMFQTSQVASLLHGNFGISKLATGLSLAFLVGIVTIGGIRRIAYVTARLVPLMGGIYVLGAMVVIFMNVDLLPSVIRQIVTGAFSGTAAAGGFAGAVISKGLQTGVQRACFSNEAGLGSAPIAHAAARTREPVREGSVALLEPFIDTVVICTMTALVILISGAWTESDLNGVQLTALAFDKSIPGFGNLFVPIAVFLFAYSTLLSWAYYGEQATKYIFDNRTSVLVYKILFCVLAVLGAVWKSGVVLDFSDMMLGLMAVPNLIAIWLLLPKVRRASSNYFRRLAAGEFEAEPVRR